MTIEHPSIARAYDAILGGKDNYAADREVAAKLLQVCPSAAEMAHNNRAWLIRAVRWLARDAGITQFLDCGSGLPTRENTHDVVQRVNPDATVIYVDNDPACVTHGRALMEGDSDLVHFADADLTEPDALLAHPIVATHLDLTIPVGLIQCGTIHHVPDERNPSGIMARYRELLPSGSYLALTHFYDPADGDYYSTLCRSMEASLATLGSGWWRDHNQIADYFGDWELVPPGLVAPQNWWPTGPSTKPHTDADELILAGIARKP